MGKNPLFVAFVIWAFVYSSFGAFSIPVSHPAARASGSLATAFRFPSLRSHRLCVRPE